MRTGAAFLATRLTGAGLALTLILTLGTDDRLTTVAFALEAVLDPPAGRALLASFPTDVPKGAGFVSAYEEVAAKASPTTTPVVATKILSSQRAAVALATPA